jgi:chromosome segregation ATPase
VCVQRHAPAAPSGGGAAMHAERVELLRKENALLSHHNAQLESEVERLHGEHDAALARNEALASESAAVAARLREKEEEVDSMDRACGSADAALRRLACTLPCLRAAHAQ